MVTAPQWNSAPAFVTTRTLTARPVFGGAVTSELVGCGVLLLRCSTGVSGLFLVMRPSTAIAQRSLIGMTYTPLEVSADLPVLQAPIAALGLLTPFLRS